MAIFTGAGVAIVTPFHADGSINYDKLEELIDFQCNHGTDSIVICGTTGESPTLSEQEHMECVKMAVCYSYIPALRACHFVEQNWRMVVKVRLFF